MTGTDDGWEAFRHYRAEADLAPRPLRLLTRPEPIEAVAEVPDGPPLRFRWRRALHEVIAAEGPERIEGAWWSEHGGPCARLFPRRGQIRPALLAVPRRALSRSGARRRGADLVPARDVCVRFSSSVMRYLEFATASNFSFLRGASHPEELMVQAAISGFAGLGLCDRNSVAGVVRAHLAKREQNLDRCAITRARGWCSPTARPTSSPIRATAPAGAGSAACSRSATCAPRRATAFCISTICWRMCFGLELIVDGRRCAAAVAPARRRRARPRAAGRLHALSRARPRPARAHRAGARSASAADRGQRRASIIIPTGGRSPTCSPASARRPPSTAPAASLPSMPSAS